MAVLSEAERLVHLEECQEPWPNLLGCIKGVAAFSLVDFYLGKDKNIQLWVFRSLFCSHIAFLIYLLIVKPKYRS